MRILEKRRAQYIKRKMKKCDFCDKKTIKDQEVKKLEGRLWLVLASKYPYLDGNLMIIPKRHLSDPDDLTEKEWQEFAVVLKNTKQALAKIFKTNSFNIALNVGDNSGASIPHLHWQIVPRPKKINPNTYNILNDFWFISLEYKDLIKKIGDLK